MIVFFLTSCNFHLSKIDKSVPFSLIELFYNCFLFGSNVEVSILRVKSKASIKNIELHHHNVMLTKDWCVLKHEMFQKVKNFCASFYCLIN